MIVHVDTDVVHDPPNRDHAPVVAIHVAVVNIETENVVVTPDLCRDVAIVGVVHHHLTIDV